MGLLITPAGTGSGSPQLFDPLYTTGRLTLVSGNAVPLTDQIAKDTLYYTSITNNGGDITTNPFEIVLYTGSALQWYESAQISLALTLTSGKNYDVFIYNNAGTLTLELSAASTNDTTRADALAAQSGLVVKSGATTRRWIGTLRASGTNLTEDSGGGYVNLTQIYGKRFLENAYNQVPRFLATCDPGTTWSYTSATIRQAQANSANQVEFVTGQTRKSILARLISCAYIKDNLAQTANVGIGLDSITAYITPVDGISFLRGQGYNTSENGIETEMTATMSGYVSIGYHYLSWLESGGDSTCLFIGGEGVSGLAAQILM